MNRKCDFVENDKAIRTKSDRILSCLNGKTCKKDIIWVLLLYIAGVTVHYFIGSFPKKITILADELLYYSIAQSIQDGNGILCLNAHTGFNKVMYSLVLSPFFGIDDPVLRVSMITLFNSALIMSSLFLVYLIGKELELNRRSMLLALLITLLCPDLMYSSSFMSENLNWPLALLAVYLWLRSKRCGRVWVYSAVLGCLCYIGYLCKDTFLAFLLSYVLFELAYPIFMYLIYRKDVPDKKLGEYYAKGCLIGCGMAIAVFAACYAAGNVLLFGGGDANAVGAISVGLRVFKNSYAFLYLLYAFAYHLAASLIAVLVLPIVYPAAGFKYMSRNTQSAFSFLMLYLLISCAIISYTISIKEDIGTTLPRVHLRYIGFILLLLIIVFLKVLQDKTETDKIISKNQCFYSVLAALPACIVFKGSYYNSIDQAMLNIYLMVSGKLPPLTYVKDDLVLYPASAAVFLVLALIIFIVDYYKKRSPKLSSYVFAVFMMLVCFQNNRMEIEEYNTDYCADEKIISDIVTANHYFDEVNGAKRILYIPGDNRSDYSKTLITYFNHTSEICHSNTEDISLLADGNGVIDVPNAEFEIAFYGFTYTYSQLSGFDYIITDRNSDIELKGVTPINEASGEFYTLYKNNEPSTVEIAPKAGAEEKSDLSTEEKTTLA